MVIAIQERFFFEHYGLTNHDLEIYLAAALSAGGDYADLYFEYLTSTSLMVDESLVKSASRFRRTHRLCLHRRSFSAADSACCPHRGTDCQRAV
jgi:hypothetical protein